MKLANVFLILVLLACSFAPTSAYNPPRPSRDVDPDHQKELFTEFRQARRELADDPTLTEQQKVDKASEIAKSRLSSR